MFKFGLWLFFSSGLSVSGRLADLIYIAGTGVVMVSEGGEHIFVDGLLEAGAHGQVV